MARYLLQQFCHGLDRHGLLLLLLTYGAVVRLVKKELSETLFLDHVAPSAGLLPPLWSVVYEEAVRGNHLLFCDNDSDLFAENSSFSTQANSNWLVSFVTSMSVKNSLSEIQAEVRALSEDKRGALFGFYVHLIQFFSYQLKDSLN